MQFPKTFGGHTAFAAQLRRVFADVRVVIEKRAGDLHADGVNHYGTGMSRLFGSVHDLGLNVAADGRDSLFEVRVVHKVLPRGFDNDAIVRRGWFVRGGSRLGTDLDVIVAIVTFKRHEVEPAGRGYKVSFLLAKGIRERGDAGVCVAGVIVLYAGWQLESKQVAKLYGLRLVRCHGRGEAGFDGPPFLPRTTTGLGGCLRSEGKQGDQSKQKACASRTFGRGNSTVRLLQVHQRDRAGRSCFLTYDPEAEGWEHTIVSRPSKAHSVSRRTGS